MPGEGPYKGINPPLLNGCLHYKVSTHEIGTLVHNDNDHNQQFIWLKCLA